MQNFQQNGDTLTLTAPTGGVTSGVPVKIGQMLVVPVATVAEDLPFAGRAEGVFSDMAKATGQTWTEGALLYWNDSTKKFTTVSDGGTMQGFAVADADTGDTTGTVLLVGAGTEAAQAALVAALTVGTLSGTANGAMESIGATNSGDVSGAISNNFKECFTQINAILTALKNAGLMAST